jgi:ABC-type transport system involved in cytochrome bd biosynthesis fused ATPase/permease subunit
MITAACAVIIAVLTVTALVLGSFTMVMFTGVLVFILGPEVWRRTVRAVRVRRHLERDRAAMHAELAALLDPRPDSDERAAP